MFAPHKKVVGGGQTFLIWSTTLHQGRHLGAGGTFAPESSEKQPIFDQKGVKARAKNFAPLETKKLLLPPEKSCNDVTALPSSTIPFGQLPREAQNSQRSTLLVLLL